MIEINHHLTDELIMGYSAGTLPEAFNLVVAAHVSMCDECRARLESYDAVGGSILEEVDTACVTEDSFERTLELISTMKKEPIKTRVTRKPSVLPEPVQDYVGGDLDRVKWRPIGGGVRQALLPTSKDASVRLLRIPGGAQMTDHGHHGTELTLVLQGAFRDESARFGRGDVEVANEEMEHTPIAEEGEDCICLAATDAPLRFNAFLPRIAQRFIRI